MIDATLIQIKVTVKEIAKTDFVDQIVVPDLHLKSWPGCFLYLSTKTLVSDINNIHILLARYVIN